MAVSSMREFKKIYSPTHKRFMFQHITGGPMWKSLRDIKPMHFKGVTGLGHAPKAKHHLKDIIANPEEQAIEIGDAIINRLKIRNNDGKDLYNISGKGTNNKDIEDIRKRIKNILGNGLNV